MTVRSCRTQSVKKIKLKSEGYCLLAALWDTQGRISQRNFMAMWLLLSEGVNCNKMFRVRHKVEKSSGN